MQCNSKKFQLGQIEFLTENREGINATLASIYIKQKYYYKTLDKYKVLEQTCNQYGQLIIF